MNRFSLLLAIAATTAAATAVVFNTSPAAAATPPDVTPAKVAASRLGNGHAVYVRGGDGRLWWRTVEEFGKPGYSTAWRPLPGAAVGSGPDVVSVSSTTLWVAAKANNGNAVVRVQNGATFGGWQNLDGTITTAPVLLHEVGTPRIWLFARGTSGGVTYRVRAASGVWGPWQSIGGQLTSAPDALLSVNGTIRVHGRGLNGDLWVRALDLSTGVWAPWERTGFAVNSATSTVRSDRVFQVMYFRGALNHIFATVDEPPHDIGGVATSAPDASFGGEVIAVRGTNGAVWAIVNGSPWRTLGGIAT
jgi:hypothetical protein